MVTDIDSIIWLDVDMMYGIEYEEFPARIAEVAMWLIDHQMNMLISEAFGKYFRRLPLKKSANITHGNALTIDWQSLLNPVNTLTVYANSASITQVGDPEVHYGHVNVIANKITESTTGGDAGKPEIRFDYIMGNPPFIGSRIMNSFQKQDLLNVFESKQNIGELDYVTGWYVKAAKYIQSTNIKVAFVSTNSIVQGLQTAILWELMLTKYNIKIHFAHRTFKWSNEARGNAAVYCIIIGFANYDSNEKVIYQYDDVKGEPQTAKVININPYLVDARNIFINKKSKPICNVPEMNFGNMPADGGEFLFTTSDKDEFILREPNATSFFRPFISANEFINNEKRWCLWLKDISPNVLGKLKQVLKKVENVKRIREKSSRPQLANIPALFAQITQPSGQDYILIPRHSSELRKYIPIGLFTAENIAADSCLIVPNGNLYHFGILTSEMHMAWVKSVCGRLKSDFRYSKDIVYNNFPWPENPIDKQIKAIEVAAQKVLDTRLLYPESSLAELYNPLTMPPDLVKAHTDLDKAVDQAYRPQPFISDANRMEFLFNLYEKYTADLFTLQKVKKSRKAKT